MSVFSIWKDQIPKLVHSSGKDPEELLKQCILGLNEEQIRNSLDACSSLDSIDYIMETVAESSTISDQEYINLTLYVRNTIIPRLNI